MWTAGHGKNIFLKLIESIKNKNKKKNEFPCIFRHKCGCHGNGWLTVLVILSIVKG